MAETAQLEEHRAALTGHCYRMLGSPADADDAVQETMIRAVRGLAGFAGRSSLRTWLIRIATRVCLDALGDRSRRARAFELGPAGRADAPLTALPAAAWIEPIPDVEAIPADADPAEATTLRQSIRLAFVAALQHLPPRQRAALLLAEVLGWSAAEIAETLDMSSAAVNSALQRARATLSARDLEDLRAPAAGAPRALLDRYVDAFERYDMDAFAALLREDATMSMPPYTLWLRGLDEIRAFMLGRGAPCRDSKLVPVAACGAPAFGQYKKEGERHLPWALTVLELDGAERVAGLTFFLDTAALFPRFALAAEV